MNAAQNGTPLVSIIMNGHNSEAYLSAAMDSVLQQTYVNWELIFWDNQSTDQTEAIVKSYQDPRIRYFKSKQFTSLGEARNLAIRQAQGDWLAFLDTDDLWYPAKLEKQAQFFPDPKVGIIICDTLFFNQKGPVKQLYKDNPPPTGSVFNALLKAYFISLETAVIKKSVYDLLAYGFDKRFSMIEEMDLFIRLSFYCELAFVPEVLAAWRIHERSWTQTKRRQFPIERRMMVATYRDLYVGKIKDLESYLEHVERVASLEESVLDLQQGASRSARAKLFPYIFHYPKYFILFLLSFLPNLILLPILKKRGLIS